MSDYDHERKNDVIIARLSQRFDDFMERYDENQNQARAWRLDFSERLSKVEDFIKEFSPMHKKIMGAIVLIVAGSMTYWLKLFWDHLRR